MKGPKPFLAQFAVAEQVPMSSPLRTGLTLVLTAVAATSLPAQSAAQACSSSLRPPVTFQQRGNACGPTSAAMALQALGESVEPDDVARRLPMSREGVDLFALQRGIEGFGWETVGGASTVEEIAEFLAEGWPVLAAVRRGGIKHLVLVVEAPGAECEESAIAYIDPVRGREVTRTVEEFEAERYEGRQTIVIGPAGQPSSRVSEEMLQADARFRARSWALRAAAHEEANDQMIELLRRSVVEDPCWEQSRDWLDRAVELTGTEGPEVPECELE